MKYYLLTFNEDWADEHNVPALECFNEDDYKRWLEAPSGKLNKRYNEQLAVYKAVVAIEEVWRKEAIKRGLWNGTKQYKDYTNEEKAFMKTYPPSSYNSHPRKVYSSIYAHLGNSGDSFEDNYSDYYLNEELVKAKIVSVYEVDESFSKHFKRASLSSLSLSNVFDIVKDDYNEEDEE